MSYSAANIAAAAGLEEPSYTVPQIFEWATTATFTAVDFLWFVNAASHVMERQAMNHEGLRVLLLNVSDWSGDLVDG